MFYQQIEVYNVAAYHFCFNTRYPLYRLKQINTPKPFVCGYALATSYTQNIHIKDLHILSNLKIVFKSQKYYVNQKLYIDL